MLIIVPFDKEYCFVDKTLLIMSTMCDTALEQICEKKYSEQLADDCYEIVISYGIAFYGKSCMVKMGETLYQTEE